MLPEWSLAYRQVGLGEWFGLGLLCCRDDRPGRKGQNTRPQLIIDESNLMRSVRGDCMRERDLESFSVVAGLREAHRGWRGLVVREGARERKTLEEDGVAQLD